jgi:hypothetical protein
MLTIQQGPLPQGALLEKYQQQGAKTDCYFIDLPNSISHSDYVEAFYTSPFFKVERVILTFLARRPSTDEQAKELALGNATHFAAWHVEGQTQDQLLLCDFLGKTRSWLMSVQDEKSNSTRLYFGSAVIPKQVKKTGKVKVGIGFRLLGGFHHLYSKALLKAACKRLL